MNLIPLSTYINRTDELYFPEAIDGTDRTKFLYNVARQNHVNTAARLLRNAERYQTRSNQFANRLLDFEAFNPNANTKKIVGQAIRLALNSIPSQPMISNWYDQPNAEVPPEYIVSFRNDIEVFTEPPAVPLPVWINSETTGLFWDIEIYKGARTRRVELVYGSSFTGFFSLTTSSSFLQIPYTTNASQDPFPVIFRARGLNSIGQSEFSEDRQTVPLFQPTTPLSLNIPIRTSTAAEFRVFVTGHLTDVRVILRRNAEPTRTNFDLSFQTVVAGGNPLLYRSSTPVTVIATPLLSGNWFAKALTLNGHRESGLSNTVSFA